MGKAAEGPANTAEGKGAEPGGVCGERDNQVEEGHWHTCVLGGDLGGSIERDRVTTSVGGGWMDYDD